MILAGPPGMGGADNRSCCCQIGREVNCCEHRYVDEDATNKSVRICTASCQSTVLTLDFTDTALRHARGLILPGSLRAEFKQGAALRSARTQGRVSNEKAQKDTLDGRLCLIFLLMNRKSLAY
jgi:hypothetical protein